MRLQNLFSRSVVCILLMMLLLGLVAVSRSLPVLASGTWNGQDSYFVPMLWCAVRGSPAASNPNIAGDTTTDGVIWRRNERPTDAILTPKAGISLRSGITTSAGNPNFPIIDDPDGIVTGTQEGDVYFPAFGSTRPLDMIIDACDEEWAKRGIAGMGITAVNVRMFHDGNDPANYYGIMGWGICNENAAGNCVAPYDSRILVIDNAFTFPGSPLRQFNPDPVDRLVAHEVSHALSLEHDLNNPNALMARMPTGDELSAQEVAALRANVLGLPGVQIDPAGVFETGRFVATRHTDPQGDNGATEESLDIVSVRVMVDKEDDVIYLEAQLRGLIPEVQELPLTFWFMADTDPVGSGLPQDVLLANAVPEVAFEEVESFVRVTVFNGDISGEIVRMADNRVLSAPVEPELLTAVMRAIAYSPNDQNPLPDAIPLRHIIRVRLSNDNLGIALGTPFRLQSAVAEENQPAFDLLEEENTEFTIDNPVFPECVALGEGIPGQLAQVEIRGLPANAPIHGLVGPTEVFRGVNTASEVSFIQMLIPPASAAGYHLLTIGVEGTALTADCIINVLQASAPVITPFGPPGTVTLVPGLP